MHRFDAHRKLNTRFAGWLVQVTLDDQREGQRKHATEPPALNAIGNTPVVRLRRVVPGGSAQVFVKLEYFNPTGSYKDRMAESIIEDAERRGDLKPGQ
ncbi:pyridoxal-phosphate dependent enzyme [Rhizobium leguminosarum]|uniref:pyridoxal-phosphate dependent enzyme n=1 Tax=Rhizobium leguminosarum TaxID=384 RepID=UPI0021BC2EE9|nr:pyridoxal-phosphate dependent enzyme [Rhizobium leguminosarum]